MKQTFVIMRKELSHYFGSPMALIFLGVFLAATLFSFFWVDTFFARGIADIRPIFRWMPILMIFLVAALTMRQWTEEQQSGTLEILLTLPVKTSQLVLGKFLAVVALIVVALLLTLSIPITVSLLGNLDWGPVIGGYLATILMAAAYIAIGLFISSRTNNQIVALILTVLVCGLLYLVGTRAITEFTSDTIGDILRTIGSGSHFESIERGVIDLRDLVYYLSIAALFLVFNTISIDSKRWSIGPHTRPYWFNALLTIPLITLNIILLNVWLAPLSGIRADLTEHNEYSLSPTTHDLLNGLSEPLLIRAYFSEKTHPLLAPLVPRIEDTLREYEVASSGQVVIDIIDPATDPDLEAEANQTYGIRPTPFQIAGRYETAVINSYFDILIRYGDQHVVLNFRDIIDVEPHRDGQVDVRLRNLEYDLTRSIKKVVSGFQSIDAILASLSEPAQLTLFVTPNMLPEPLQDAPDTIQTVAEQIQTESNGKFTFETINPDEPGSSVTRDDLWQTYNIQPIALSLFSQESYYLHMVLRVGDKGQVLFPSSDLSEAGIRTSIESALKRNTSGFLKVVGLWRPPNTPTQNVFGQMQQPISAWQTIAEQLRRDYEVRDLDLADGQVPSDVDVLFVVAPRNLTDRQLFAIDQYLMRGGSVVVAAGNYGIAPDPFAGGLGLEKLEGNLQQMLSSYGIDVQDTLVLDPQNEPFPVPVVRDLGGIQVQEIQPLNYPFFVDVQATNMAEDSPIVANLPAVTLHWASPVIVQEPEDEEIAWDVVTLLQSSDQAWLRNDTTINPNLELYPDLGFPIEGEQKSYPLAVAVQGQFQSFFTGQESPLLTPAAPDPNAPPAPDNPAAGAVGVIETSPETTRLIVVGSAEFLDDSIFELSASLSGERYLNSLQFAQNVVDWSVEDLDLLNIRASGAQLRILNPIADGSEILWELGNSFIILVALIIIGIIWMVRRSNERPMILTPQPTTTKQEVSSEYS